MVKALTQIAIDARVKAGAPVKREEIADGRVPGLRLVLQPSGAMSWAYRYKLSGKPKKLTLGHYSQKQGEGGLTLAQARLKGQAAIGRLHDGKDPSAEKQAQKRLLAEEALKQVENEQERFEKVFELFMRRDVEPKNKTAHEIRKTFERRFIPDWGKKQVSELTRKDVLKVLDSIMDEGHHTAANRAYSAIHRFGAWCVERGILDVNFCAGVKKPAPERSRDRILTSDEIKLFWKATGEAGYPFGSWARLMLLTGARRTEVARLEFTELDFEKGEWQLPAERSKNGAAHLMPLPKLAVEELKQAPKVGSKPKYVFTSGAQEVEGVCPPISGYSKFKVWLDVRMAELAVGAPEGQGDGAEVPHWTYHDLRRTSASLMGELGIPPHVVEAALNHKTGKVQGVAKVYNRYDYLQERKQALEALAARIEEVASGKGASSNVVRMRG